MKFWLIAIICVLVAAVCVYAVMRYTKKKNYGGYAYYSEKKKKSKKKVPYAYKATVYIDGMTCDHCKERVSNLLNSDGYIAGVSLENKCAYIWSQSPIDEAKIKEIIDNSGFEFVRFSDNTL